MLYEIEQAVFERFPGYARMAVVAEGVDNTREIPELAELLAQCEEGVRRDDLEDFWHVPVLETWAEAFSGMGIKPKKNPPSVINLVKRCRAGKPLPFINPLVAIFNCISLKYLLPCGGDDRNVIEGDLRLGIADGTENYVPLGQPDVLEHPQPGEVIYYDTATKGVLPGMVLEERQPQQIDARNHECGDQCGRDAASALGDRRTGRRRSRRAAPPLHWSQDGHP